MSEYTVIKSKYGLRYLKDKKLFSKDKIPANIFTQLEEGKVVSDEGVKLEGPIKQCIFCGMSCRNQKLLNGELVYLCDNDYYDKTTGQIAQRIRQNKET